MLILVPTPIDEESQLESTAKERILFDLEHNPEKTLILVEDLKPGRQRWLRWGMPREWIERFVAYNEHTRHNIMNDMVLAMKSGSKIYLMSDGGLPAFCDPGMELVDLCHQQRIRVTATPFPHSIALALAMSGFPHNQYRFLGFPPQKADERTKYFKDMVNMPETLILMDAPYRLKKVLEELIASGMNRELYLGLDLNSSNELGLRGQVSKIMNKIPNEKREFIVVIAPRL
ncbi:MAG: hypothetical protein COW00_12355 [Bdellovibrio sp. CG12_big_fil_rev_8_21_14_0_65_39_13]|nr:MAG: hypothetical protein COW78_20110 [Bdellovibrio sp. CG22_combo_CG10-13_8_21_14_all_39_27]PIQ59061.1 MAG: hypothetical protein COW00_12355 [Bdellovibrio sp. CG12_big_fil_rev_8_21_14_0_65_39_13]PIR35003.1 MAG: hypothetical protein COV37_10825 [Bdellovibrio sp. CG11_big_fil_rev_8_21_14_0_20_39_38]PJB54216.1 MAG: hypothetical protein CO099_02800 [Bdellovibrio sp. CG_4_9_14_3_um_filter_39_7]